MVIWASGLLTDCLCRVLPRTTKTKSSYQRTLYLHRTFLAVANQGIFNSYFENGANYVIPDSPIGEEGSVPRERVRHLSMEFILWETTVQLVSVPSRYSENGFHFVGTLFFNRTASTRSSNLRARTIAIYLTALSALRCVLLTHSPPPAYFSQVNP